MRPLYTLDEFNSSKSLIKLPFECEFCKSTFYITKSLITYELKNKRGRINFCSKKCKSNSQITQLTVQCKNCNKLFFKSQSEIKKTSNHFCCQSCSGTYNNTHKTIGTRRSKLEIYLEQQLKIIYPTFKIDFNKKDTINSELDIYIPSLKLAFELNGIFHYEPIFGPEKLSQIQNNDQRKFQACAEKNISLCIIDSSNMKKFKEHKAKVFLAIITEIINQSID